MADDKAYMAEALEWALRYAAMGWRVFPCHSIKADGSCTCRKSACTDIGKHPRTERGLNDASRDKAQIEKWFGPKAKLSNVAIRTGKVSGVTVGDIDCGQGKVGMQTWVELIQEHGEPQTLKAETGGGGYHLFFQYTAALKTGNDRLGKNIDVKNDGGYVIVAPSRHKSGGAYKWMNWGEALVAVPPHLKPKDEKQKLWSPGNDDPQFTLDEAKDMLTKVPADDRDTWFKVGIILGRTFPDNDEAYAAYHEWADTWGGKKGQKHDQTMHECFYVLSKQEADPKLTIGTLLKWARDNGWIPAGVRELNKQYAVVWMGGDCVVLREHTAPDTGLLDVSFATKGAVKLFHAADPKVGRVNRVEYWLRHPSRRTYDGLVFQPGPTPCDPKLYNLWHGFAVEPKQGNCDLYLEHLRENIVCGNKEYERYLLAWMANVVQNPGHRPGVAVVMRSGQGTGKGILAKGFGRLFAPHFAHITNSHQLVGRFNALLKKAIVVFADEAFWAGDKQAEGTLNALITEETHNIELKGIDPITVNNYMHLLIASNHDWVVPSPKDARRFFVLDVSERHMQDHAYFEKLTDQMKNRGSAALLYYLLHYNHEDVNLRHAPRTLGLTDQKINSLSSMEKFWFECLCAGSQLRDGGHYWHPKLASKQLHDAYIEWAKGAGIVRRSMEMELMDVLKKLVPGLTKAKVRVEKPEGTMQARGWEFPKLEECQKAFDLHMKWNYQWDKDEDYQDDLGDQVVPPQTSS